MIIFINKYIKLYKKNKFLIIRIIVIINLVV